MDRFVRLTTVMMSACLLAAPIHVDGLEKTLNSRQQMLNQFNGGNSTTPSSPATAPVAPTQPSYGSPITVRKLLVPSSSCAAAILNGQGQGGDITPQAASYQYDGSADSLIRSAMRLLGMACRWGGTSVRTGLDCNGFVQYIFRNSMGISLSHTSAMQAQMGTTVSHSELQPGDVVFFCTVRGRISHIGLLIGNSRFIHAPRTGRRIKITDPSNKYRNRKYAFGHRMKKNDLSCFLS